MSSSLASADFISLIKPFTPDALANGFATLIGALIGAMLAYLLQRRFQRSQEHKADLMAAHRLMFSLLQQINTIVLIQRDHVFSELKNPARFMSIPALGFFDTKKNILELPELAFLLRDSESRAILYDFYVAQENYVEALTQWNLRSQFHLEQFQPAMAATGIANGTAVTHDTMRKALGDRIYLHAVAATENGISMLPRAFQKLAAVKDRARPYIVRRFKSDDFTNFDFPDTWGLVSTPDKQA